MSRADLGKLLAAKDLRKIAEADKELSAHLTQVGEALSAAEKAATAWHKALGEATKRWETSLAELSKLHSGQEG